MKALIVLMMLVPTMAFAYVSEEGKDDPIKKEEPSQDRTTKKDPDADFKKATADYEKKLKQYQDRHPEMYKGHDQNKK